MPDIRSFFGAKGGAPPKPVASKTDDTAKSSRAKRNVVADSDDEDQPPAKTTKAKAAPKKKTGSEKEPHGVAISADDYFASSKNGKSSSTTTPTKASAKTTVKTEVPVRSSPRGKQAASAPQPRNGTAKRRSTTTPRAAATREDDDAYKEEGDEDDEDIFAADAKGRSKRKNDDYMDEDSEEEVLPQPKRIASRGRPSAASKAKKKEEEDEDEEDFKPQQKAAASRKRKTPEDDSEEEEEEKPRKKAAPSKPRAPRTKKTDDAEDPEYAKLLDSVTTVRAPTPPKEEEGKKFDWRQAKGGGNAAVQPQGAAEIPDGEDGCLTGLSFVFTGVLKTIGRDEGQELVKKYGGKVTGQPSGKTDFVVLGDDAGPSKLKKIKEAGIKTIDENGLFELIKKLPAFGGGGKGAAKAMEKKQSELDKVKQQAQEMEAEEKARQVEAARLAKKAAAARGTTVTAAPPPTPPSAQLLTSKYAPTSLTHICGNKGNVEKIQNWLRGWPKAKKYDFKKRGADGLGGERAIIISGPPGIGKTTAAHLAARLEGYDVLESNASDTRSKKLVEAGVSDVMNNTSLLGYFAGDGRKVDAAKKKIVLVMDEVDGMSGGDRGGVGALAKFCKKTEVPLILICNERKLPKMKPFDHVAFDIKFQRPTVDQIRSRIMTICHREGLRLPPNVVDALIEGSNKDIRQIINMISTAKLDQSSMDYGQSKAMSKAWEKHVVLKPWDICQKMLAGGLFAPASKATLNDKIELYFNDHEFSFLMIQENYLRTKPMALTNKGYSQREERLKALELFDQAAESISDGDLVDRMIHGPQQHWSLMPTHAVFSTVRPSSFVAGQLMGSNFTSWLGNFSKSGKLGRLNREVHAHMRLRTSGDHNEIRQEYLPVLWERTVNKLQHEGTDAVPDVIELMDSYYLTREDFDSIQELGVGRMSEDIVKIETATKSAFTRKYNAASHPVPFMKASSIAAPVKAAAKEAPDLEEAIEEEDDAQAAEPAEAADEDEIDLKKDKYIKQPKKKPAAKKATAKAGAGKDGDASPQKARGRPKAAASKAKAKR